MIAPPKLSPTGRPREPADTPQEDPYLCVGVCMADPDSGYCLGCGRPPLIVPAVVAEPAPVADQPAYRNIGADSPE